MGAKSNMSNNDTTTPSEQNSNTDTSASLSIDTIYGALKIIDIAAQRGAFHGEELTPVGHVRDTIANFITAISPKSGDTETNEDSGKDSGKDSGNTTTN